MENDLKATFDACNTFNNKLSDTIKSLIGANSDRKSEIDALRGDHEDLKKAHESFQTSMERENDLRKNEIRFEDFEFHISVANVAMYFEYISEKGVEIPHVCTSAHP